MDEYGQDCVQIVAQANAHSMLTTMNTMLSTQGKEYADPIRTNTSYSCGRYVCT